MRTTQHTMYTHFSASHRTVYSFFFVATAADAIPSHMLTLNFNENQLQMGLFFSSLLFFNSFEQYLCLPRYNMRRQTASGCSKHRRYFHWIGRDRGLCNHKNSTVRKWCRSSLSFVLNDFSVVVIVHTRMRKSFIVELCFYSAVIRWWYALYFFRHIKFDATNCLLVRLCVCACPFVKTK